MADKSFGVKELNLISASGTPTITSPNSVNINATNVAISTDITVGGMVSLGAGTSISSPGTNVLTFGTNSTEKVRITSDGDVQARRARSNTTGDVALSFQPSDSTIHYGFRIDSANNNLNLDRVGTGNFVSIDANGDVGIGTDNPEGQLHLNGTTRYVQTISAINGVTAGTTSGTIYRQQYTNDSTSRRMGFFGIKRSAGSGDQRAKFVMELCPDNSTNLGLSSPANNTTAFEFNHNGTILVKNGGGIDFSETSNSSGTMSSELLDDYEEGTWTPALQNAGSPTVSSAVGIYTKIGHFVHCTFYMAFTGASLSNQSRISGLPFAYSGVEPSVFLSRVGQAHDSSASAGSRTAKAIGHTSSGTTWIYVDIITSGSSVNPRGEFVIRAA